MVLDWNITTLWPPLAVAYRAVARQGVPRESAEVQQTLDQVHSSLDILEGLLEGRDYVAGGQGGGSFGIGDIPPAVSLSRWRFLGRDLARWPAVEAWYRRCAARPAFQARIEIGRAHV